MYWPDINTNNDNTISAYELCKVPWTSQQQEPLLSDDHPTRPFESVSNDFFNMAGKAFLVIAEQLTDMSSLHHTTHSQTAMLK